MPPRSSVPNTSHLFLVANTEILNKQNKFDFSRNPSPKSQKIMPQNGYIFCLASPENSTIMKVDWMPMTTMSALEYKHFKALVYMRESSRGYAGWTIVAAKYNVPNPKMEYAKLVNYLDHIHTQPELGMYFVSQQVIHKYFDRIGGTDYNMDY